MSRKNKATLSPNAEKKSEKFTHGDLLRRALAIDGSRVSTPRTRSNEKAFAAKNYGKGKKARSRPNWKDRQKRSKKLSAPVKPQMWITLIWHMRLRMPWTWKTGASTSSERQHLMDMLKTEKFPENTLFCGDAGFVGYEFWNAILNDGHHFLVRVGANVRLLKNLGYVRERNGIVCVWPDAAMRRHQPPLVLRLIQIKNERGTMSLVTSVLSPRTSRTAGCCDVELDWSLAGLWIIQLFAVKEQIKIDRPPENSSISLSLSIIQDTMDMCHETALDGSVQSRQLRDAVQDDYVRSGSKAARYKPNKKDKPSAQNPIVITANAKQKQALSLLNASPYIFP